MKICVGAAELDELAEPEERRVVGHPRRLLHVVRDDHDRVVLLQIVDQLFDTLRGNRVERRRGLVHQQNLGPHRERAGDAQPLLLAARQRERGGVQPILHLVPERGVLKAFLDAVAQVRPVARPSR